MINKFNFKKHLSKILILTILLSTCLVYFSSTAEATTFKSIKDTISNSGPSMTNVTHTFVASTTLAVASNGYFEIVFPTGFSNVLVGGVTCPNLSSTGVASVPTTNTVRCTYANGVSEATTSTIIVTGVTNPSAVGSYLFIETTKTSADVQIEKSSLRVAIVNNVLVTASVDPSLTFTVSGLATSSVINGITTTSSSTYRTMAFGVLAPGVKKSLGQKLNVSTNAPYGFSVTVAQDHNLISSAGADIDSFKDGAAASSTPLVWSAPTAVLGQEATYGHFGITSADTSLTGGNIFSGSKYKGFWGTTPIEVMYHNGVADGLTAGVGSTTVAYSAEISAMQESGDYSNTLTYVCTPTY